MFWTFLTDMLRGLYARAVCSDAFPSPQCVRWRPDFEPRFTSCFLALEKDHRFDSLHHFIRGPFHIVCAKQDRPLQQKQVYIYNNNPAKNKFQNAVWGVYSEVPSNKPSPSLCSPTLTVYRTNQVVRRTTAQQPSLEIRVRTRTHARVPVAQCARASGRGVAGRAGGRAGACVRACVCYGTM